MIIDITGYRRRHVDDRMVKMLGAFGCVAVEGPKWCGKTWTALRHSNSSFMVGDPANNFSNRRLAQMDPSLVLPGEAPRLVDEWQEVPAIWDAVRAEVDVRGRRGQIILTGSATPQRKGVLHSGAGRIGKLRMRPMSLYESGDSSGEVSLRSLFEEGIDPMATGRVSLARLVYLIVRGGWPASIGVGEDAAGEAPAAYIRAILDEDLPKLDGVNIDVSKMEQLLRSLARNESTTASRATLRRDMAQEGGKAIDEDTISKYLEILGRMFLIDDQPPFSPNMRSSVRVKQQAKRHLADPSLACALMRATPERLVADLDTLGFLFEGMVERDLRIYAEAIGASLFHYQDYRGKEIDAVVELADGRWAAIEVKLGASQIDQASASLVHLRESFLKEGLGKEPSVLCVICGLTDAVYRRPDGVFVVPPTALRE